LVYHWKDYAPGEAEKVRERLVELGVPDDGTPRLLDVACGTGGHLVHLKQWFDVAACDLNAEMLLIARERLPGLPLWQSDMRTVSLSDSSRRSVPWEQVDAVTCLFSSIGYLPDTDEPCLDGDG
jgi:ubiquinone/menaquinone biosynthesis C-methylase UbiE